MQFHHLGIGIGKPLSNKVLEPWVFRRRTRFGTEVVYSDTVREVVDFYNRHHVPCALMMLSDQSPNHADKCLPGPLSSIRRRPSSTVPNISHANTITLCWHYRVDKVRRGRYR